MCEKTSWNPDKHHLRNERMPRGLYHGEQLTDSWDPVTSRKVEFIGKPSDTGAIVMATLAGKQPNLIGSKVHDLSFIGSDKLSMHAPLIDLDVPIKVLKSSTPEHYHLYIERYVEWEKYLDMLRAMTTAGIVQTGYYEAALVHKQTFLRWNTTKQEERGRG